MSPLHAEIVALRKQGLSQDEIGRRVGRTQSLISAILVTYGMGVRTYPHTVNRRKRDGTVDAPATETWEPYRILHPTVAKLVKERYFTPPSALKGTLRRKVTPTVPTVWEMVGRG